MHAYLGYFQTRAVIIITIGHIGHILLKLSLRKAAWAGKSLFLPSSWFWNIQIHPDSLVLLRPKWKIFVQGNGLKKARKGRDWVSLQFFFNSQNLFTNTFFPPFWSKNMPFPPFWKYFFQKSSKNPRVGGVLLGGGWSGCPKHRFF